MSQGNIEDDAAVVNTILLWRIYDLMLLDLMARNPELARKVATAHERGEFIGPNPAFSKDSE
nr:MetaGeneMark_Unknown Function [uncultured bacterium]